MSASSLLTAVRLRLSRGKGGAETKKIPPFFGFLFLLCFVFFFFCEVGWVGVESPCSITDTSNLIRIVVVYV